MHSVLVAPLAVLLELDTLRIILLVLGGRVITALALGAGQSDHRTHEFSFNDYFCKALRQRTHISTSARKAEPEASGSA